MRLPFLYNSNLYTWYLLTLPPLQTEAGRRDLVSTILLHVASNLSGEDMDVNVIPKFRMPVDARFEYAQNAGVVDYLIVKCPKPLSGENHLPLCVVIYC